MLRVLLFCYLNTLLMSCSGQPVSSDTSRYKLTELDQPFLGMYSIYADEDLIGEYDGEKLIKVYLRVSVDKNKKAQTINQKINLLMAHPIPYLILMFE